MKQLALLMQDKEVLQYFGLNIQVGCAAGHGGQQFGCVGISVASVLPNTPSMLNQSDFLGCIIGQIYEI